MDPSLLLAVSLALFVGSAFLLILTLIVAAYTWWMIRKAEEAEAARAAELEPDFSHLNVGDAEQPVPSLLSQHTDHDAEDVDDMATEVFSPELLGTHAGGSSFTLGGGNRDK